MSIRLGIIGLSADTAAWAPKTHIVPLKSSPLSEKYSVVAVATSKPETAEAAAKAYDIPKEKAYSSPEAIALDSDVDMVVVSVKVRGVLYLRPDHSILETNDWYRGKSVTNFGLAGTTTQAADHSRFRSEERRLRGMAFGKWSSRSRGAGCISQEAGCEDARRSAE